MTERLAGKHRPVNFDNGVTVFVATCEECDVPWPCDVEKAYEAESIELYEAEHEGQEPF